MSKVDITHWDVENNEFWESTGKFVAKRNLWISIPSLLCGFAVWLMWADSWFSFLHWISL